MTRASPLLSPPWPSSWTAASAVASRLPTACVLRRVGRLIVPRTRRENGRASGRAGHLARYLDGKADSDEHGEVTLRLSDARNSEESYTFLTVVVNRHKEKHAGAGRSLPLRSSGRG